MDILARTTPASVALETTLLVHGVPRDASNRLARELHEVVTTHHAHPAVVGVLHGRPIVGMDFNEIVELLAADNIPKANTSNLGIYLHRKSHAATTVSTTAELAAAAGVRLFATGGLGGVHRNFAAHLDISSDLPALARFPVAVVCSGVKSLLDVEATREALETLGVPVIGYRTGRFPAFYLRESAASVDARFDDPAELAAFIAAELARTRRGIVVCNPIPHASAIEPARFQSWLREAERLTESAGPRGRGVTPAVLAALHHISDGATLRANLALVRDNAALAAQLAANLARLS